MPMNSVKNIKVWQLLHVFDNEYIYNIEANDYIKNLLSGFHSNGDKKKC